MISILELPKVSRIANTAPPFAVTFTSDMVHSRRDDLYRKNLNMFINSAIPAHSLPNTYYLARFLHRFLALC